MLFFPFLEVTPIPAKTAGKVQVICPLMASHAHHTVSPAATANQTHATLFGASGVPSLELIATSSQHAQIPESVDEPKRKRRR
jgi:hypothetical protein